MSLRRAAAALAAAAASAATGAARAEDAVLLWGNYYKERSTRVVEPIVQVRKDLPGRAELEATYLVDQITSASGAFTVTDQPFREHRQEGRIGGRVRLGRFLPGLRARYSHEPDYDSAGGGADLAVSARGARSTLRATVERVEDFVGQRNNAEFHDRLSTTLLGLGWSEALRPDLAAGVSLEHQRLRGYQENVYRVEVHPRARDRWAAAVWAAWHAPTRTTLRAGYRHYRDDWELAAHTLEGEAVQRLHPDLHLLARLRRHTQGEVAFASFSQDPKLGAFSATLYGASLRWRQSWLRSTFLSPLRRSLVEPGYAYLDQRNFYRPAHLIQLGWTWPF